MSAASGGKGLKRVVGVSGLTMAIINGTIGSGIYALPANVSFELGAFGIYAYLFCSIMLASILLCYAEIGSKVSISGGSYAYVETAFGHLPGYITNWMYFFGWGVLGSAAVLNIMADAVSLLFPIFSQTGFRALLFFVLIALIVGVNIRGTKQGVGIIKIFTIVKLFPLVAIIFFGFSRIKAVNLHWEHFPSLQSFGVTALELFFAFAGFETSLNVSGEIKNSKRTVPISILLAGTIVFIVYMLIQIVTQGILGVNMAEHQLSPLAAVAVIIIGPLGGTIVLYATAISCFGTTSGDIMATPRLLFAGAQNGFFPKFLAKIHPRFATPFWSIIIYGGLIFIFSVSGGFRQLAVLASGSILIIYFAVIASTLKLKLRKHALAEKTFRIPGGWSIPVIGMISIAWLLSNLNGRQIISTLTFIGIVTVLFFITKRISKANGTDPKENNPNQPNQ
ncbi:MAG: amino acid permease [Terrimonas sp.]|nr:amino acid permease [Terrimonas sp.]